MNRSMLLALPFVCVLIVSGCGKSEPETTTSTSPAEASPSEASPSEASPTDEATESGADAESETPDSETSSSNEADAASSDPAGSVESEEPVASASTGTLKIRFQYGGGPVEAGALNITQDAAFCGQHSLKDEKLVVHPENQGLKNVVVYVYTGRGGSEIDPVPPANKTVTFANKNCRFEPHIGVVQVGDKILVTNPDPIGHNFNVSFFANKAVNVNVPAGESQEIVPEQAEPAPIPIACNIHPWMTGYVLVLDHPYVGVSDENGDLTIENLPAGESLVFRAFHESGAIRTVQIDGKDVDWKRSRFTVDIKAGSNDLGTLVVPAFAE